MREEEYDDSLSWLCVCGEWIENGMHCPSCYAEPPWGCDCSDCHDRYRERYEEYEPWDGWLDPFDEDLKKSRKPLKFTRAEFGVKRNAKDS